ncbi:MAG: hypothetical protein ACJ76I_05945 [Gaiellaceae bacterium]
MPISSDFHVFEDGDIVGVSVRLDDGSVVEEEADFHSIGTLDGVAYLHHYLWRGDYAGDLIPLDTVVGLRLITKRAERSPHDHDPYLDWYSVRALIRFPAPSQSERDSYYEERVTVWRAEVPEDARYHADNEIAEYLNGTAGQCIAMQEPFKLAGRPHNGAEVFSQWCQSELGPDDYVAAFHELHGREGGATDRTPAAQDDKP